MRLNQLAKKVGKPYTRIEKYIRKDLKIEGIEGPNTRLDEDIVKKVISKFGLATEANQEKPKPKMETIEAKPAEISPEERGLEDVNLEFATPAESVVPNLEGLGDNKSLDSQEILSEESDLSENEVNSSVDAADSIDADIVSEDKVVVKDKVVKETVSTEETVLHLDNEGTIIAPKVELEGITVKGKIEIPGVTDKPEVEESNEVELTAEQEADIKAKEEERLAEENRKEEARRKKIDADAAKAAAYKAKKEKEAQEILRVKIQEEKRKKREEGKKHYLNNVQQTPVGTKNKKKKAKAVIEAEENKVFETKEKYIETENMTTWQKIVRWFNT